MQVPLILRGAKTVTPSSVLEEGAVYVENGTITDVLPSRGRTTSQCVDVDGCYLLPGLIDLHSDVIEAAMEPRVGAVLPPDLSLPSLEVNLFSSGITTVFHALLMLDVPVRRKSVSSANTIIESLVTAEAQGLLVGTHLVTLRCELTEDESVKHFLQLAKNPMIRGVSLEDHTPNSADSELYFNRYCRTQLGLTEHQIQEYLVQKKEGIKHFWARAKSIAVKAVHDGLHLLAHDVSAVADLQQFKTLGVEIGEFPTNAEVCLAAKDLGIKLSIGAPNLVVGHSQSGNISAKLLVASGLVDIVCSDYHPPSLLSSVFQMWQDGHVTLCDSVGMATRTVATTMGLSERGSIEPGKRADLIVVRLINGRPIVEQTYVEGRLVYSRSRLPRHRQSSTPMCLANFS